MKETIDNLGTKADYLKDLNVPFRKNNVVEYFPTIDNIHYVSFRKNSKIY